MTQDIMELFRKLVASGGEANLFNVYKGIPLSFPAKIVSVDEETLHVLTDSYQTVCMYMEKKTFIQSRELPEVLQAEVIELNTEDQVATLGNFSIAEPGIGHRAQARIPPKDPLECKIRKLLNDYTVQGELADISQDGLAVYLPKGIFSLKQFREGTQVAATLLLPGEFMVGQPYLTNPAPLENPDDPFTREMTRLNPMAGSEPGASTAMQNISSLQPTINPEVSIHAVVAYLHREKAHSLYRIGMRFLPGDPTQVLIAQFIAQRQSEIIREIKIMYNLLGKIAGK